MAPSRNRNSRSKPRRFSEGSQHRMQPPSTYKGSKRPVRKFGDTTPQIPGVDIAALHTSASIPNDIPQAPGIPHHNLFNPASMIYYGLTVDKIIIERMSSLLAFEYADTAARVRSVTDAQKLVDIIDSLTNNEAFLSQCGCDAARKAALLALEIYARVPLLPRSVFLNGSTQQCDWHFETSSGDLEFIYQSTFISRILNHDYILPAWCIYQGDEANFVDGSIDEHGESVDEWLNRARPNFVMKVRVMLQIARIIRYIHSMNAAIALSPHVIHSESVALDSNLRAKLFAQQVKEYLIYDREESGRLANWTPESNISAFANLFLSVCFSSCKENLPNDLVEDARQLIERCRAKDPKIQPTMENVVKEMETWNLA